MVIRRAVVGDLLEINEIYNHYVVGSTCTYQTEVTSEQERRDWFERHGGKYAVFVAEEEGRVLGWGSISAVHERAAYRFSVEGSVYVREGFHRRGIGRGLMEEVIRAAKGGGFHTLLAAISVDQEASVGLHRSLGFLEVARFKEIGFKFGRWLDVVWMQLML